MGMARYGCKQLAAQVLTGLLEASVYTDLHRLPELFCGFARRPGKAPTLYPVACAPQAWSAAAVFLALQACIGLSVQAPENQIRFFHPILPESIPLLEIQDLRVNQSSVDLQLEGYGEAVALRVKRRHGDVEVMMST